MKPLVSIVMATYNGAKYLEAQIQSILSQSYSNIEVIITDDCSTDDSLRIIQQAVKSDPRVKVHRNPENIGFVKNFMGALCHAKGELICFSDQDDFWHEDKLNILAQLICDNPSNMLAYCDLEICDERISYF